MLFNTFTVRQDVFLSATVKMKNYKVYIYSGQI